MKRKNKWKLIAPCEVCGNEIVYKRNKLIRCDFCKTRLYWDGNEPQEVRGKWGE